MSIQTQHHSPQFSQFILWLKRGNLQELRRFFPLRDIDTWIRQKYRSRFYSKINLTKLRYEIFSELIGPLFLNLGISIRDEEKPWKHRKDNLFCLYKDFLRELRQIEKEGSTVNKFEIALKKFHSDFKEILPSLVPPFSWMLESKKPLHNLGFTSKKFKKKWEELMDEKIKIEERMNDFLGENLEREIVKGWRIKNDELEITEKQFIQIKREEYELYQKLRLAIEIFERILSYLKEAKGKPGRHPKPFNVLIYHVINKCTFRKFDENRNYIYHEDGKYKLERDWRLILFLILYFYVRLDKKIELSELKKFISKYRKKSAREALKILKRRLWEIYKNFPPLDGWPFESKITETGFRKLLVKDGNLKIIRL